MKCPTCGFINSAVLETRTMLAGAVIKRRRECEKCANRFSTLEKLDSVELMVRKKDRTKEPFNKTKIINGMVLALEKRPYQKEKLEDIVDQMQDELLSRGVRIIDSTEIGDMTMKYLKELDKVGYLRFASVYYSFDSVNSFVRELENLR